MHLRPIAAGLVISRKGLVFIKSSGKAKQQVLTRSQMKISCMNSISSSHPKRTSHNKYSTVRNLGIFFNKKNFHNCRENNFKIKSLLSTSRLSHPLSTILKIYKRSIRTESWRKSCRLCGEQTLKPGSLGKSSPSWSTLSSDQQRQSTFWTNKRFLILRNYISNTCFIGGLKSFRVFLEGTLQHCSLPVNP